MVGGIHRQLVKSNCEIDGFIVEESQGLGGVSWIYKVNQSDGLGSRGAVESSRASCSSTF